MKLNIINRMRKQLWLLPILLLSMGVVQAQEREDKIELTFGGITSWSGVESTLSEVSLDKYVDVTTETFLLTYGTDSEEFRTGLLTVVKALDKDLLITKELFKSISVSRSVGGDTPGSVFFEIVKYKEGKSVADLFTLPALKPNVGNVEIEFKFSNFWDVVEKATIDNVVFENGVYENKDEEGNVTLTVNATVEADEDSDGISIKITPKDLFVAVEDITVIYGDKMPEHKFLFEGFAYDDTEENVFEEGKGIADYLGIAYYEAISGGSVATNVPVVGSPMKLAGGEYLMDLEDGPLSLPNYTLIPVNHKGVLGASTIVPDKKGDIETGVLTVEKAELTLSIKARERQYDDLNAVAMEVGVPATAAPKGIYVTPSSDFNVKGLKNDDALATLLANFTNMEGIPTAKDADGVLHSTDKSDVGGYSLGLDPSKEKDILAIFSPYYIVNGNVSGEYNDQKYTKITGVFDVKKDDIVLTVYKFDELFYDEVVMQKIYGEKNPVGYFYLEKRMEKQDSPAPSPSPSYSFAQNAANYLTASTEALSGFDTAPIFGLLEDNKLVDPFDDTTPVKLDEFNKATPYTATVANKPTSKNYNITVENGSFLINKRPLEFLGLEVNRVYGEADTDTLWHLESTKTKRISGLSAADQKKYTISEKYPEYVIVPDYRLKEIVDIITPIFKHTAKTATNQLDAGTYRDVLDFFTFTEFGWLKSLSTNYELDFDIMKATDWRLENQKDIEHYKHMAIKVSKADLLIDFKDLEIPYGEKIPNLNLLSTQEKFVTYNGEKLLKFDRTADMLGENWMQNLYVNRPAGSELTLHESKLFYNELLPVGHYEIKGIEEINKTSKNFNITFVKETTKLIINKSGNFTIDWNPSVDLYLDDRREQQVGLLHNGVSVTPGDYFEIKSSQPEAVEVIRQGASDFWLRVLDVPMTGFVDITVSYNDPNMEVADKVVTFKVNRPLNDVDVVVTIGNTTFTYDGKSHDIKSLVDVVAKKQDENYIKLVTYDGGIEAPTNAGSYGFQIWAVKINKKGETSSPILVREEALVINPKKVQVSAIDQTYAYGNVADYNLNYVVADGGFINGDYFPQDDQPKVELLEDFTGVGEYTLVVSGGNAGLNYEVIYNNGKLTITKKTLTIEAVSKTIAYGDALPTFELKYTGFVKGENADNLNYIYEAVLSSKYTTDKGAVGAYDIAVVSTGDIEPNYAVTKTPGILTVGQADPELQWTMDSYNVEIGDVVTLVVASKSDAKISIVNNTTGQMHAELNELKDGYTLKGMSRGTIELAASQAETKNYKAATKAQKFTIIDPITGIEAVESGKVTIYPTLVENNITVQSEVRIESVYVIDLTGKVQKAIQAPESQIDLSTLNRGHHVIVVNLEGGSTEMVRILKK